MKRQKAPPVRDLLIPPELLAQYPALYDGAIVDLKGNGTMHGIPIVADGRYRVVVAKPEQPR